MIAELENIKNYLLAKYPQYNEGFANVSKPNGTDIVIDDNANYVGISDNKGNYFYLRSLKESTYEPFTYSCRPLSYRKTTSCRIVSLIKGAQDDQHLIALVDGISRAGNAVTRSVIDKTQVFFEETGTRNITDGLKSVSLISIDFQVVEIVSAKNCSLEICDC